MTNPRDSDETTRNSPDELDRGLAEAFGNEDAGTFSPSVLRALQARSESVLGVHLESHGIDDAPVAVTDEAKKLRDFSGRYHVLGEIGRGGVGIVYKGRDHDLGRDVAMKVLKDEFAARPDVLGRFIEEAQIGGQLQHPGIVPVYELGLQAGERPYFAMKLVKGETLATHLGRRDGPSQDRRRLLGVFEQVCQTMAYAHARRVVHRDLKPANVMIGSFGEVQVVDWGLAKVLPKAGADRSEPLEHVSEHSVIETVRSSSASGSESIAGSVLGTPAYMSPEQATGDLARVDVRSDVFGLGAILCEILTGAPPYRESRGDVVRQAANAALDEAHTRLRECGADESLVKLCRACLAPSRQARPSSACDVAQQVGQYLTSVEDRARQAEVRAAELRYRHRTTLAATLAVLLIFALGAGAWSWAERDSRAHRAEVTQKVATARSAASAALGRAQAAGLDLSLWTLAVASAEQLASLARLDDVEEDVRRDAEGFLSTVLEERRVATASAERRERDDSMLARLENLRIPVDEDIREAYRDFTEFRRLDVEYAAAFAHYLGDRALLEMPVELSLAALRQGEIAIELATSLDHWGLTRDRLSASSDPPDANATARLRELAVLLDGGDPWRTQLRTLLPHAADEGERLRRLAEEANYTALTGAGCRVLGEALWVAGEQEEAVQTFRQGLELHPRDFDLCFRLGLHFVLMDQPRWLEAYQTFRIANALKPDHNEVLHRMGMALDKLQRYADSERIWHELISRDPSNTDWMGHLGWTRELRGETESAIDCYRQSLELNPGDVSAHQYLGRLLNRLGRNDEALQLFRDAVQNNPPNAELYNLLGLELATRGQHEEAIECYERALEIGARTPGTVHSNLGLAYLSLGQMEQAVRCFDEAIEATPDRWELHSLRGVALSRMNDVNGAVQSLRRVLELDPQNRKTWHDLGQILFASGDVKGADRCFRRVLELDPRFPPAHYNLGMVHERNADFSAAEESYETAAQLFSEQDSEFARTWESNARGRIRILRSFEEVLSGEREVTSSAEWDGIVHLALSLRRWHEVVGLTERTIQRAPELIDGAEWGLYNSVCAAVLALDRSEETTKGERARLDRLALDWLTIEIDRWTGWIAEDERAEAARAKLAHTLTDPDLAGVRGEALAEWSESDRAAWQSLWSRIEAALAEGER